MLRAKGKIGKVSVLASFALAGVLLAASLALAGCSQGGADNQPASSGASGSNGGGQVEESNLSTKGGPMASFAANSAAIELEGDENACYSPASYYMALAMVAAGADGDAQQQLLSALGLKGSTVKELDDYCQEQIRDIGRTDDSGVTEVANSLWSNVGYTFQSEYQEAGKECFDAGAFDVEFGTQQTNDMIRDWISEETRGLLEPEISTDAGMVAMLVNTIYFKDDWIEPFVEGETASAPFHAEGGDVEAQFMHNTTDYGTYIEGDGFIAAQLPFAGGSTCTFYLPDEGKTVGELLETPDSVTALLSAEPNSQAQISWSVPRFETASSFDDLVDCAKKLGVTDIFNAANGDMFRNMIVADNGADLRFYVSDIVQETKIELNEFGAEAAAYTAAIARATSLGPESDEMVEFVLDRPFAYAITAPNGVPLFIGVVANPAE